MYILASLRILGVAQQAQGTQDQHESYLNSGSLLLVRAVRTAASPVWPEQEGRGRDGGWRKHTDEECMQRQHMWNIMK